jgi:hypothetical protein
MRPMQVRKARKDPHFRVLAALSERSEPERQGAVATQRGIEGRVVARSGLTWGDLACIVGGSGEQRRSRQ